MGDKTKIEWTRGDDGTPGATWNPLTGCEAVSPGCDHCYAARQASGRLKNHLAYAGLAEGGVFTGDIRLLTDRLDEPFHWTKPRRIFVNSMSDLFYKAVPDSFIAEVFEVMDAANWHTYQILTKRPQRMAKLLRRWFDRWDEAESGRVAEAGWFPAPHVWLGTSIESDKYTFRADHLRDTPAAVRFLSCEPLLGPLPSLDLTDIDWVIVGGESGPGARPMHPDWVRDIRDRCVAAGVAFHFKQHGEYRQREGDEAPAIIVARDGQTWSPTSNGIPLFERHCAVMARPGKKAAGRELDGRTWDEYPA